jgi:hypothetical protein
MTLVSKYQDSHAAEGFISVDGTEMYRISRFDEMPPFLMSITSDANLWMYLSSTGGLTAGRIDENSALFPYECEDRLHRLGGITGPISLIRLENEGRSVLWEPFSSGRLESRIDRNLYKSPLSNRVLFEEIHHTLGMGFRYTWSGCDEFGFVREAKLTNLGRRPMEMHLLDGLLNILPAGVNLGTMQYASCLVDAYKRSEIDPASGIAIYSLTSLISDRPEPGESLRASAAWSRGLPKASILLDEENVRRFRSKRNLVAEPLLTGKRCAFLLESRLTLAPGESIEWTIAADVGLDHLKLEQLRNRLSSEEDPRPDVRQKLEECEEGLGGIVATCDGLQASADQIASTHHASNVLFNAMRGGFPVNQYQVRVADFMHFVKDRNHPVYIANEAILKSWPSDLSVEGVIELAGQTGAADLVRLAMEYLPLTFARRHGDPSRPWNRFTIHLKNSDGSRRIGYQGNWRDIFQNWEALAWSFPNLLESFIAKFVNASTIDGYNPYDPWSNIGYWGDHQIIYLLKLLEAASHFHPGVLQRLMVQPIFSYANVPYRLQTFSLICKDPRNTVLFDRELSKEIESRKRSIGADGKLLLDAEGNVYHATLFEKLLVSLLSKLSNFVIGGGIWMNTQRPEWNDANNALTGSGVSVVTVCYLRRYVQHLLHILGEISEQGVRLSAEVVEWERQIHDTFSRHLRFRDALDTSPSRRRGMLDEVGAIFDCYRQKVYASGFAGAMTVPIRTMIPLLEDTLRVIDRTIQQNRRPDGLYHAYNLLDLSHPQIALLQPLQEMLEGQVAALSSGSLTTGAARKLLESLFDSALWREDQQSFMLYPPRELPGFLELNLVPEALAQSNPLLIELLGDGEQSIISRDASGNLRFSGDFHHARDLDTALNRLARQGRWQPLIISHRKSVMDVFESVFQHHAFTGRSGRMYAYEGLGCIYWHMVAKLLLAAQEIFWKASDENAPETGDIAAIYYRIRAGLGFNKRARDYGAVPIDPYSHTPAGGGARQPGMTGQVKEEILTRLGEWGVRIQKGQIFFQPALLRQTELLPQPSEFEYVRLDGEAERIKLPEMSAAFTFCQTPVVYSLREESPMLEVHFPDGRVSRANELKLSRDHSAGIFARTGDIKMIHVHIPLAYLLVIQSF